jgi:hypothetical protein
MIDYVRMPKDHGPLRARPEELAAERRRFGFRRLAVRFGGMEWIVNIKPVLRVYRVPPAIPPDGVGGKGSTSRVGSLTPTGSKVGLLDFSFTAPACRRNYFVDASFGYNAFRPSASAGTRDPLRAQGRRRGRGLHWKRRRGLKHRHRGHR